uniref:Uncharacterized protein n=1 Tax=Nelumbo nucifera TaxID=4432 RepID=A0A822XGL9_NELNU|nr:TPA_asm: hypothetical protein HUJ06_019438 [Nelumbo nucifera]
MEYQILCTKANQYASTRKQNEALCEEVNRLYTMLRNKGLDPDVVPLSEGLIGLATCVPEDDDNGADLPVGVVGGTTGVEQSLERTSTVAPSCEIVNVSPSIASSYKHKFSRARRERKQRNTVVSPYLAPGQQGQVAKEFAIAARSKRAIKEKVK